MARPLSLRASLGQLKLGPWMAVAFSVVFGFTTLVWLDPKSLETNAAIHRESFPTGAAIASAGLVAVLAGYLLTPRNLRAAFNRLDAAVRGTRAPREPTSLSVLTLWGIAMFALFAQIRNGSFGYLSDPTAALQETSSVSAILSTLASVGLLATLIAAWRLSKLPSINTRLTLALVLGSQITAGLFAGTKEGPIIHVIAAFVGYGLHKKIRVLPVILVLLFTVLFVFPFVSQYRDQVNTGSGRLSPAEALGSIDFTTIIDSALNSSSGDNADTAGLRLSRISDISIIVEKTPESVPYQPSTDLLAGPFLGIIPRSVWPQKPVLDAGYQMSSVYYGLPTSVKTSSALTPYGDLWRHGGLPIVVIGMASIGVLARMIDSRSGNPRDDPRILFLPMLLFTSVVKQETDYLAFTASLVSVMVIAGIAARVVANTSPSVQQPN